MHCPGIIFSLTLKICLPCFLCIFPLDKMLKSFGSWEYARFVLESPSSASSVKSNLRFKFGNKNLMQSLIKLQSTRTITLFHHNLRMQEFLLFHLHRRSSSLCVSCPFNLIVMFFYVIIIACFYSNDSAPTILLRMLHFVRSRSSTPSWSVRRIKSFSTLHCYYHCMMILWTVWRIIVGVFNDEEVEKKIIELRECENVYFIYR